jgi:hypothetical protein
VDSHGRGLVHQATHLAPGDDPAPARTLRVGAQELPDTLLGVVPKSIVWLLIRPCTGAAGVRCVNALKYHSSRHHSGHAFRQPHAAFAFLLDHVPNWKWAFAPSSSR